MRTIVITGAGGALGQAVVAHIKQIFPACRLLLTSREVRSAPFVELNLQKREQIGVFVRENSPDLVLHLAASFSDDFEEAYAINVGAARHLCEAISEQGLKTRVVVIGSAAEYGVIAPHENPVGTNHVLNPVSLYGMTKAWQSLLVSHHAANGVNVVNARIFNLSGSGMSERLFIGRVQKQLAEMAGGQRSQLEVGPLSAVRDYVSTAEAARQLLAIAEFGNAGATYHIGSGKPVLMRTLLARYLAAAGLDNSVVLENPSLSNRKGYDVPMIVADMSATFALMEMQNGQTETDSSKPGL